MSGAFSDNQPDYSWLQPHETRSFSMNWYPFRDIGGVKKANLDAAVNLEVASGSAKVGFYTTAAHAAVQVRLKAGDKILLQETIGINPAKPYVKQVALPAGVDEHDLVASISDQGRELISYSPIRLTPMAMPKTVTPPAPPRDIKTNEELYLIGLRAQQFHDPGIDPIPYWEEALRRDPGDARVNTALGITQFTKARYDDAEKYLRTALERPTDRYTAPKDAEAIYYLGATLKAAGRADEAYTYFYRATWSQAWKAAGYYLLAEIAASRGDMAAALDFADRSIDSNALDIRAQNLKAAVLRHLGRPKEAIEALAAAHKIDPLDVRSMAEKWLSSKSPEAARTMASTMLLHPATAQETAAEYLNAGLWQDGTDVLLEMAGAAPEKSKIHPMAYYYLGYFAGKLGQPEKAASYDKQAMALPPDYVFPFQNEATEALRAAMKINPRDARAPYYLGNVLYDWQPEEATRMWEASVAIDPSFAVVHRNLATAYSNLKLQPDLDRAIAEMEKAVAAERKYPRHFAELDELYEQAGVPLEKRVPVFNRNSAVVAQRDDAQNRAVALKVATGEYDEAIRMMTGRHFAVAEGANLNVSEHWTDAHILRSQKYIQAKRYQDALADLQAAVTIPANLPLGAAGFANAGRNAEVAWWTGVAYDGLGDRQKAIDSWQRAAQTVAASAQQYYQALALEKLGQADRAKTIFAGLVESGKSSLRQPAPSGAPGRGGRGARAMTPRARMANAHYLTGLGYLGLNDSTQAKAELSQAVEISPDLVGARVALGGMR
jgi:tetratricopeptide (TPR) repeat protein